MTTYRVLHEGVVHSATLHRMPVERGTLWVARSACGMRVPASAETEMALTCPGCMTADDSRTTRTGEAA